MSEKPIKKCCACFKNAREPGQATCQPCSDAPKKVYQQPSAATNKVLNNENPRPITNVGFTLDQKKNLRSLINKACEDNNYVIKKSALFMKDHELSKCCLDIIEILPTYRNYWNMHCCNEI